MKKSPRRTNNALSHPHLHDQEEPGDDDVGEVAGEEGEQERGQDAVLRAHAGDYQRFLRTLAT